MGNPAKRLGVGDHTEKEIKSHPFFRELTGSNWRPERFNLLSNQEFLIPARLKILIHNSRGCPWPGLLQMTRRNSFSITFVETSSKDSVLSMMNILSTVATCEETYSTELLFSLSCNAFTKILYPVLTYIKFIDF